MGGGTTDHSSQVLSFVILIDCHLEIVPLPNMREKKNHNKAKNILSLSDPFQQSIGLKPSRHRCLKQRTCLSCIAESGLMLPEQIHTNTCPVLTGHDSDYPWPRCAGHDSDYPRPHRAPGISCFSSLTSFRFSPWRKHAMRAQPE